MKGTVPSVLEHGGQITIFEVYKYGRWQRADLRSRPRIAGLPTRYRKVTISGLGDLIAKKISVTGTFNPAAVQGLGGGDAVERAARAGEQTAKNTKRLVDLANAGGLTFG